MNPKRAEQSGRTSSTSSCEVTCIRKLAISPTYATAACFHSQPLLFATFTTHHSPVFFLLSIRTINHSINSDMSPTPTPALPRLKIAIIDARLAGSLSARVLREQHNVHVYERARGTTEVGAAINVGPNGVIMLETLGFDRARVGSLAARQINTYNHTGDLINEAKRDFASQFGADWLFQRRADLHAEFVRLATDDEDPKIPGLPARFIIRLLWLGLILRVGLWSLRTGARSGLIWLWELMASNLFFATRLSERKPSVPHGRQVFRLSVLRLRKSRYSRLLVGSLVRWIQGCL